MRRNVWFSIFSTKTTGIGDAGEWRAKRARYFDKTNLSIRYCNTNSQRLTLIAYH